MEIVKTLRLKTDTAPLQHDGPSFRIMNYYYLFFVTKQTSLKVENGEYWHYVLLSCKLQKVNNNLYERIKKKKEQK